MSISSVTSEALQLKLRQLLPSQQGFGTDLSASDTIIPIIDLTRAAEGSDVGVNLQTALAYNSQTSFVANNNTVVLANTPGFYRVFGNASLRTTSTVLVFANIKLEDGISAKNVWTFHGVKGTTDLGLSDNFDFVVFLATGESIVSNTNNANAFCAGSTRQIADVNGTLIQPVGFTPQ
tara:strand:+ start:146 stop:679 length:534 start_codon:yes stop_codon:yes gene_type:complete